MYYFAAYGLTIASEFPFPELVPIVPAGTDAYDILIRFQEPRTISKHSDEPGYGFQQEGPDAHLFLPGTGAFWMRGGREIEVIPDFEASQQALRLFVLGPALAYILHQRGNLILHASAVGLRTAVARPSEVVAFLGQSREGKSTMAAALCARGHRAMSDDIVAIRLSSLDPAASHAPPTPIMIEPGFPVLKLWPEASERAYGSGEGSEPHAPIALSNPRRARYVGEGFTLDPLPLKRLYLLGEGSEIHAERLTPHAALVQLLQHAYWAAYISNHQLHLLFRQCAVLVRRVPIYRLERPRNLALLDEVARYVESVNDE